MRFEHPRRFMPRADSGARCRNCPRKPDAKREARTRPPAAAVSPPDGTIALMARRLFTFCAAVSLLLCAATCALWVRSYRVGDSVLNMRDAAGGRWWSRTTFDAVSGRGGVIVRVYRESYTFPAPQGEGCVAIPEGGVSPSRPPTWYVGHDADPTYTGTFFRSVCPAAPVRCGVGW